MDVESRRCFYLEKTLELNEAIEQNKKAGREIDKQRYKEDDANERYGSDRKKDDKITVTLERETWSYVLASLDVRVYQLGIQKKIADAEFDKLEEQCAAKLMEDEYKRIEKLFKGLEEND